MYTVRIDFYMYMSFDMIYKCTVGSHLDKQCLKHANIVVVSYLWNGGSMYSISIHHTQYTVCILYIICMLYNYLLLMLLNVMPSCKLVYYWTL